MKKKIIAKKKAVKKPSRRPLRQEMGLTAIIPYSEIAKPEMYKGKYSITASRFNDTQIKSIIAHTPAHIVKKRPGKGGGEWSYVPGWWFKKKLNFTFGFDGWNTEIDGERIDGDFITVKGRLVITNTKDGKPMVTKADYGGAEIKFKKGTAHTPQNYLDIANDFKAAQTDLVKRCCVQLGFAMDIYGTGESMEAGQTVVEPPQSPATSPKQPSPVTKTIESTAREVKSAPKTDYVKKLEEGLAARDLKTMKAKHKYISQVAGLAAAYSYAEGIRKGFTSNEAQSLIFQIRQGEAKGKS